MVNRVLTIRSFCIIALLLLTGAATQVAAQNTAFTYQGRLNDNGNPANGQYDLQFKLFDTATVGTGTQQGSTITLSAVTVTSGSFSVSLDFGACASCFNGSARFLEIAIRPTSGGSFTTLSPRQPLQSSPYAIRSLNAAAADGLSLACVNCVTSSQIQSVNGSAVTGTIPVASVPAGSGNYIQNSISPQASSNFNVSGNGIIGGNLGIGTSTPASRLHVIGGDILFENKWRTEATTYAPNLIGGFLGTGSIGAMPGNRATAGVVGAIIGGGGFNGTLSYPSGGGITGDFSNRVTDWFGTVGGGFGNRAGNDDATLDNSAFATVGGGYRNTASGSEATVGGGESNTASNTVATVGGGAANTASGDAATVGGGAQNRAIGAKATVAGGDTNTAGDGASVGGGQLNTASGAYATVGGGNLNVASGFGATVPGGQSSQAQGNWSFAAGLRAKANHQGAFVWGDSTDVDFTSTGGNQFLIRATGGVGIGTNSPQAQLHVVGNGLITGNLTVNGTLNLPSLAGQFIQNSTTQQANANFNVSGNGTLGGSLNASAGVNAFSESNIAVHATSPSGTAGLFEGRLHVFRDGNPTADLQTSQFRIIGQTNSARQFIFGYDTTANVGVIQAADTLVGKPMSLNPIGGFLGVGTVNPNSHIHLKANAPQGFAIQMENTSTATRLYIGNYGTTGGGDHWPGLDSANSSFLYSENNLVFTTPGGIHFSGSTTAEHMGILPNGNVGIGIANPSYKFEVNSTNANAFAAHVRTSGLSQGTSYGLVVSAGTDALDSALQIRDQAGNPLMRVRGNGYVGVGTTNALNRLHVSTSESGGVYAARVENTASANGSNGMLISSGDSEFSWPFYVQNRTGSNFLFGVRANGMVQIGDGVANLLSKLTVNGKTLMSGNLEVTGTIAVHTDGPTGTGQQAFLCISSLTDELTRCPSSIRFKKNVNDLRLGFDLIRRLRPGTFDWMGDNAHDLGLIAEEVATVEPLLATYEKDGRVRGVKYERIGVVLINAVKEQQEQIESLRAANAALKQQNAALQQRDAQIDTRLSAIERRLRTVARRASLRRSAKASGKGARK